MKHKIGWYYLAHFGYNMWEDPLVDRLGIRGTDMAQFSNPYTNASHKLLFQEDYWKELSAQLQEAGCTTIVLDVGEGVIFDSHPELAVEGSWPKQRLADELDRLRSMGFEVLPKLNFSAGHDQWLGEYARMLSTSTYYKVTQDLITETAELFDKPRLFHLGMDEETPQHQRLHNYVVVRQGEQWWYDFNKLISVTQSVGSRPWVWADYGWHHEDVFFRNMSKEVVQSNWYYFDFKEEPLDILYTSLYRKLEAAGFDQIPTGSNWNVLDNFSRTVAYCGEIIAPERLLGYMQTPWHPTVRERKDAHDRAVADMARGIKIYNG